MKDKESGTRSKEPIIDMETVLGAIGEVRECESGQRSNSLDLIEEEPALREFLGGALLEIAGRMALDGAPPPVVRMVHCETAFLLAVTFSAVRQAYRRLYEDLLPQAETAAEPAGYKDHDQSNSPDECGDTTHGPSKQKEPKS